MKTYFRERSTERKLFVSELRSELSHYGKRYEESGSASASIHRGWMDFKAMFTSDNDESMLEESIRGEKKALKEYDEALKPGGGRNNCHLITQLKGKNPIWAGKDQNHERFSITY